MKLFVPLVIILCLLLLGILFKSSNDLYTIGLLLMFIIIVVMTFVYFVEYDLNYVFTLFVIFISIYILTKFPGAKEIQIYANLLIIFTYSIFLLCRIDFGQLFRFSLFSFSINKVIFIGFCVALLYSVLIINLSDFLKISGFLRVMMFVFGFLIFYREIPKILLRNDKSVKRFIIFLFVLGIFTSLYGILGIFIDIIPGKYTSLQASFFRHPNTSAFIYSFSIPCGFYLLLFEEDRISFISKFVIIIFILISIFALIFTFSRAGIIAFLISTSILFYHYSKKFFIGGILVFFLSIPIILKDFFLIKGAASALSRYALFFAAVDLLKNSKTAFMWGFGTVSCFEVFRNHAMLFNPLEDDVSFPHNIILFYILQFGAISLFFLSLSFVILILKSIISLIRGQYSKLTLLSFAIVVGILFQSLLEDVLLFPEFYVYPIFLIFLGTMTYRQVDTNSRQSNKEVTFD